MTDLQPEKPSSKPKMIVTLLAFVTVVGFLGSLYMYLKDMVVEEAHAQDDPFQILRSNDFGEALTEVKKANQSYEFSSRDLNFHQTLLGKQSASAWRAEDAGFDNSEKTVADYILFHSASELESKKRQWIPDEMSEVYENQLVKKHGRYSVHVTSFNHQRTAKGLVRLLESRDYPAYRTWRKVENRGVVWRIRVGPFKYLRDANAASQKLEKEERINTFVFHHRKKK